MRSDSSKPRNEVVHQSRQFTRWGGTVFTTLCGRVRTTGDGMNIGKKVTCKLCLRKKAKKP